MKAGDIVMVFGNPAKSTHPIDQAKLIEKAGGVNGKFENWWIEYLNDPDHKYIALIKKTNGESK